MALAAVGGLVGQVVVGLRRRPRLVYWVAGPPLWLMFVVAALFVYFVLALYWP